MDGYRNNNLNTIENYSPNGRNNITNNLDLEDTIVGYDMDVLLDQIHKTEDLDVLDDIYSKFQSEMLRKTDQLKSVQSQTAEMKNASTSRKSVVSEMDQLQSTKQQNSDNFRKIIESRRRELEILHTQQVDDLIQFENYVQQISEQFTGAPHDNESNILMETVMQLRDDLDANVNELAQYKEDMLAAELKFKKKREDNCYTAPSLKIFEEGISDISVLNEKIVTTVEQITNKVNSYRCEMGNFNNHLVSHKP